MKNLFYLEKPSLKRKKEAIEYVEEFNKYNSNINGSSSLQNYINNYEEWLIKIKKNENEKTCMSNRCPEYVYFLMKDKRIVGMVSLRYNLNQELLIHGGNIGYSIRPTERRKGYNKINLYLALTKAKNIGLEKVLLTAYDWNIASIKTILSLNGVLENQIKLEKGLLNRYWINVNETIELNKEKHKKYIKEKG